MDTEIVKLASDIKNNTGVDFNLYNVEGSLLFGDEKIRESIPNNVDGAFSDVTLNRTLFSFVFRGEKITGRISGSSKAERAYAYFISSILERKGETALLTEDGFYKALLFGELDHAEISRYLNKYSIENKPVVAILITCDGKISDVINVVKGFDNNEKEIIIKLDENQCVVAKFIDEVSNEYISINEYAEFVMRSVLDEYGIETFIALGGTAKDITKLGNSFLQALTVQRICSDQPKGQVRYFKEFILEKMIEDLPKNKISAFLDLLVDEKAKNIFNDSEMIETANEFLGNSLNASETSRKLYLHRNTLTYRLDKIENETGLDLRKFSDAVTFRIILILIKLQGK